ncbi:MAG: hypothetical protein ACI4AI_05930 [Paludibacteraceae bacterium]
MANRQEIVCDYIYSNLVQFNRLRHDVVTNKVQIAFDNRCAKVHTAPLHGRASDVSALPTGRTALAPVGLSAFVQHCLYPAEQAGL